ncbi:MAG: hypothetical protein IJI42_09290 [Methanobrevibacter sp.]|nr:hypothetical protein [Methanobrevibacter sp.]
MNNYNGILKYIQEEIVPKYPEIESCTMHVLPGSLDKNIEYIFKLNSSMSENEFWRLWADVDFEIHKFYDDLNLNFDFITILI